MSCIGQKIEFVKDLEKAILKVQTNIQSITYEVYNTNEYGRVEYLVVVYAGGAKAVRNCNADSYSAIFEELGKLLDHGYWSELDMYEEILAIGKRIYE